MAPFTERQRVNLVSFVVTLGVLFVAVKMSSGSFATRINKISESLDKALSEVMDERMANFTELSDNGTYVSDVNFNSKGMAGLYNLTNDFMEVVLSKNLNASDFFTLDNSGTLQLADFQSSWQSLLAKYAGLLTIVIILAIILILLPLCGLFFCCCRCCGKCGARSQPFDKKHDLCKKIVLATLLISLGTLLLFGVVCAFVSNQQMQEGIDELTTNLRNGVKDVNTYLDTTKGQVDTLLNVNYGEFEEVLLITIDESSTAVSKQLAEYSNAISMTELANVVNSTCGIQEGFKTLKYSTNSLRVYASQLNDAVRKLKKDMLDLLNSPECAALPKCNQLSQNITNLQTNIHFNNLPDITKTLEELNEFAADTSMFAAIQDGMDKLTNIKETIDVKVNDTLIQAKAKIKEAGAQIKLGSTNVTEVVVDLKQQIDGSTNPALNTADDYISEYGPYRYYVSLVLSCVLLLISLCIALGLICGICGKRPDGYGDDCCNKGAGSQFLICGVIWMFLIGFVIAAAVLISFLLGVGVQRVFCDSLRDPKNSEIFKLIDKANFSQLYINLTLSDTLTKCHENKSIYEVFNLKDKFDLDAVQDYVNKFDINSTLANLDLSKILPDDFSIIDDDNMAKLEAFANSDFANFNFDEFTGLLDENFITVNLTDLSNELSKVIEEVEPVEPSLATSLGTSKMHIDIYEEKIVQPMIKNASAVIDLARQLEIDLKFNRSSFKEAMDLLLTELKSTNDILRINGTDFLTQAVKNFTSGILGQIQGYLDRIVSKTRDEVGRCGPLSRVINAILTSTCDKILQPWNGYWFGLFWSVLIFIPTIIVSVKLATLYQKHSAYSRDLVEAEYLYDAYVDRDNIPLNSRSGKSKKKNKKHKRYEDRPVPSAGGDMVVREYAAGSNHQDARYADMAPKQWEDFPAGGPPQYQRAPTEYERPPPYYYPGAGDNTQ